MRGCVDGVHLGLEHLYLVVGDWRFLFFVIVEEGREEIGNGLTLGVAHGIDGSEGTFGYELVLQAVAATVAHDD